MKDVINVLRSLLDIHVSPHVIQLVGAFWDFLSGHKIDFDNPSVS